MNEDISSRLDAQDKKLDAIHKSIERMRKYFLWKFIIMLILFILPLLGIAISLPWLMTTLLSGYDI